MRIYFWPIVSSNRLKMRIISKLLMDISPANNIFYYYYSFIRNTKRMLVGYNADCNLIIPGREIAAIHYAAGMENTAYAESVMKLMLKNGGSWFELSPMTGDHSK